MKACWPEGSLRAYHDGELSPIDKQTVAAHLAVCPHCEALADEVAGRADRVAKLMSALPRTEQVIWMPRRVAAPARKPALTWPVWAGAAMALAAGIAIAMWMAPKPEEHRANVPVPVVKPEETAGVPIILPGKRRVEEPRATPASVRTPARPVRRQSPRPVFLSLDDQPVETGIILRVALGEAGIPADVIFGTDGRAHAIRLVNSTSQK